MRQLKNGDFSLTPSPRPSPIKGEIETVLLSTLHPNISTETPIKTNLNVVRQAHQKRNQQVSVRPEPVEGLNRHFPSIER